MTGFRLDVMRDLADQLTRFAPSARLAEQAGKVAALRADVDPERVYPYQFVVWRITGFRPEDRPRLILPGADLAADLVYLERLLCSSLPELPGEQPEEVLTLGELGTRLGVSTRTLRRWQTLGLVGSPVVVEGKRRLLFRWSEVERFVARNAARVERGARFERMEASERDSILERVRAFANEGFGLLQASRRAAREFGRAVETVRALVKNHDRTSPRAALYPARTGPFDRLTKWDIYSSYRRGQSVENIAKSHQRSRNSVYRVIHEVRAQRLAELNIDLISSPAFEDATLESEILGPMPNEADYESRRSAMRAPRDVPAELASLYLVPLLEKDQEQHLFRQMNFLKCQALRLRDSFCTTDIDGARVVEPAKVKISTLDEIDSLLKQATRIRDLLINANMRLVVNIAKKHTAPGDSLFEVISDGNVSLMKAVEKFDYTRGFKFSTYASWAIMKNFSRSLPDEKVRRDRFLTGQEEIFDLRADLRSNESDLLSQQARATESVHGLLEQLDPRERAIIRLRAGLESDMPRGLTLAEIGNRFGITKERVRQLHARSMRKLRTLAQDQHVDAP